MKKIPEADTLDEICWNELLYGAKDLLKFKATVILDKVPSTVEPVGTYILSEVLGNIDDVAINEIPFTSNDWLEGLSTAPEKFKVVLPEIT